MGAENVMLEENEEHQMNGESDKQGDATKSQQGKYHGPTGSERFLSRDYLLQYAIEEKLKGLT